MKTHTGFYALIYKDSALLTILKSRGPYIDTYDLPGGRPEKGEEPFETLQREVLEETGILVKEATFYKTVTIQTEHLFHTAHFYKVSSFDASHFNPTPRLEDALEAKWLPLQELSHYPLSPLVVKATAE